MNLHIVSLPHTEVSPDFCGCAFTAKVLKFCKMMGDAYNITVYAPEGPPIPGAELMNCLDREERIKIFGPDDSSRLPNWPTEQQSAVFHARVIDRMKRYLGKPQDELILLTMGYTSRCIKDAFPGFISCEPGVGYLGICTDKCAFESHAWRHTVYAKKNINDGRWFDTVIPNYFDVDDFPNLNTGKGDYLLFLGRLVKRKGPDIAAEIAQASGMRLLVAGAGGKQVGPDIVAPEITVKNATYCGPVGIAERSRLLAGARALIVPTTYIEPFGGVTIEAMLSGTPVLTTNWGAFTETVTECVTGSRFSTLQEAVDAVDRLSYNPTRPRDIRFLAQQHYSFDAVRPQFVQWFNQLATLWGKGWYERKKKSVTSSGIVW